MLGVMFVEKGKATLIDEPVPVCDMNGVLLKTRYSGLTNGTERNVLLGGNYGGSWPARCGYQLVSQVVEVGDQVTDYQVGELVYSGSFPGHVAYHLVQDNMPIIKLPEGFDLQEAALLGVACVPMHDIRRADTRIDDNVLVSGAGLIGQFAAQAARAVGARVTVLDIDDDRLTLAADLGADVTVNVNTEQGQQQLQCLKPFTVAIEASGADAPLAQIIGTTWGNGLIGHRGRVLIIAGRMDVCYNFNAGQGSEVALLHASHFDQSDLEQVVRLVMKGVIRIKPLIRDVIPITDAPRIYDALRDAPNTLLGTVFSWE